MKANTIQVVITTTDAQHKHLKACLDSLVGQTRKADDIVVVDYGQSPKAKELCVRYAPHSVRYRRLKAADDMVRRKFGAESGKASLVVFLQGVPRLSPGVLHEAAAKIATTGSDGLLHPQGPGLPPCLVVKRSELENGFNWDAWVGMLTARSEMVVMPPAPDRPTPPSSMPPHKVAVIVACHPPYLGYLPRCLRSVLAQDVPADCDIDITVAYDGEACVGLSNVVHGVGLRWDNVMARPYHNVCNIRNWAASQRTADAYLFVDADNTLAPGYLASMVNTMRADPRVAVAYPQVKVVTPTGAVQRGPVRREYSWNQLVIQNYIENCSMVRADAFWAAGGFDPEVHGYMDWDLWMRILRPDTGNIAAPCDAVLNYLKHDGAMSENSVKRFWPQKVRLSRARRAVFIPISGREYCLAPMLRFLTNMPDSSKTALYLYDNSPADSPVTKAMLDFARDAANKWEDIHYHRDTLQLSDVLPRDAKFDQYRGMTNAELMAHTLGHEARSAVARSMAQRTTAIFNWALDHVREELMLIVEDDTEPPANVWDELLDPLRGQVAVAPAAISGWYNDRFRLRPIVAREAGRSPLRHQPLAPPTEGDGRPTVEAVHATGFGAMVVSLATLRLHGVRFRPWAESPDQIIFGTDNAFGYDLQTKRLSQYVHWGVRCKHWQTETEYV